MKLSLKLFSSILVVLFSNPNGLLISNVGAHGPMESPQEIARRAEHVAAVKRSFSKCAEKLRSRDLLEQRLHRRNALVDEFVAMKKRAGVDINLNPALRKRDLSGQVDLESLFPTNPTCVLAPELTIGPFYAPRQLIRSDMREDIDGIELLLGLLIMDVNNCEVVPNVMVDFWHCSNIGVYSAFEVEGTEGETFNRGLQATGDDGIVTMTTIFPGWYPGRATHIHIAAHLNGTISPDGDYYSGGVHPHIGQLFFPESVLEQIQSNSHYAANNASRTLNSEDSIYKDGSADDFDPEMDVHFITEGDIESGIVATMVIGIDTSKNYSLTWGDSQQGGGDTTGPPPGNPTENSNPTTSLDPTATGSVGSITSIFSFQNLWVSSFVSVVLGLYLFNR